MMLLFNETKATQAAARLLFLRGGTMSYVKLIKLLYLADREALIRWGRPITTDCYVSLDNGPVVSRIYDLIRDEPQPNSFLIWRKFISDPESYEVHVLDDPGSGELSGAEQEVIDQVFAAAWPPEPVGSGGVHPNAARVDLSGWRRPARSSIATF